MGVAGASESPVGQGGIRYLTIDLFIWRCGTVLVHIEVTMHQHHLEHHCPLQFQW